MEISILDNDMGATAVPLQRGRFRVANLFRLWIGVLFFFYVVSLTCSMAGMEIFAWSTVVFFIIYAALNNKGKNGVVFYSLGIEIPLLLLVLVAFLGLRLNAPQSDFVLAFGRLRNFLLIYGFTYCLQMVGDIKKFVLVLISCATIVGVYGIWQHYSGIDLWRHNNRALMLIPWSDQKLYSTVGFFNHHLTYAHSFAMILCAPWAILLVMGARLKGWQRAFTFVALAVIGTSILFTFARGAWIALVISLPLMAAFVNRRFVISILLLLGVATSILYSTNQVFRDRAQSIFAKDYQSNEERRKLWEANFEMFREHPWIGVGLRQNEPESNLYYKKLGITDGMAGHAHNNYIEFLSTTGLIGFFCYLALIGIIFFKSLKLYWSLPQEQFWTRAIVLGAIGAQITFHIGGLTQCNIGDFKVQHQLFFWFAVILYLSKFSEQQQQPRWSNVK